MSSNTGNEPRSIVLCEHQSPLFPMSLGGEIFLPAAVIGTGGVDFMITLLLEIVKVFVVLIERDVTRAPDDSSGPNVMRLEVRIVSYPVGRQCGDYNKYPRMILSF